MAVATQLPRDLYTNGNFVLASGPVHPIPRSLVLLLGEKDDLMPNEFSPFQASIIPAWDAAQSAHAYAVAYNPTAPDRLNLTLQGEKAYSVFYPNVEAHVVLEANHGVVTQEAGRRLLNRNALIGDTCEDHKSDCDAREPTCSSSEKTRWQCASTCFPFLARDERPYSECSIHRSEGKCFKRSVSRRCERTCCGLKKKR